MLGKRVGPSLCVRIAVPESQGDNALLPEQSHSIEQNSAVNAAAAIERAVIGLPDHGPLRATGIVSEDPACVPACQHSQCANACRHREIQQRCKLRADLVWGDFAHLSYLSCG